MTSVVLCKISQPSRKKRKSYDGKFVTAKCSSINDGATSKEQTQKELWDKIVVVVHVVEGLKKAYW